MDDQMLAIAVEEVIGARAVQSLAHRPDVRLDDAPAELTVERRELELREKVGGIVGRHAATFARSRRRARRPPRRGRRSRQAATGEIRANTRRETALSASVEKI